MDPLPKQRYPPVHNNIVLTLEGPENKHPSALYTETGVRRGHFVVSPEWISEGFSYPQHPTRSYKPWAYEFPGARQWNGQEASPTAVPNPQNQS